LSNGAKSAQTKPTQHLTSFDPDSKPIGIDNQCTACISRDLKHFESPPLSTGLAIKGFDGTRTTGVFKETLLWL
jgi:hypothetical protein